MVAHGARGADGGTDEDGRTDGGNNLKAAANDADRAFTAECRSGNVTEFGSIYLHVFSLLNIVNYIQVGQKLRPQLYYGNLQTSEKVQSPWLGFLCQLSSLQSQKNDVIMES